MKTPPVIAASVAALLIAGCSSADKGGEAAQPKGSTSSAPTAPDSPQRTLHFEAATVTTVEQALDASQVAVSDTITKELDRVTVKDSPEDPGLPYVLYALHVDEAHGATGATMVTIVDFDRDQLHIDADIPRTRVGQKGDFFLHTTDTEERHMVSEHGWTYAVTAFTPQAAAQTPDRDGSVLTVAKADRQDLPERFAAKNRGKTLHAPRG